MKIYKQKSHNKILSNLAMMSALGVFLFLFEAIVLHNTYLIGINWNLFLAWVPLFIVLYMNKQVKAKALSKNRMLIYSFLWLLFFPNAPYIITDLVHLHPYQGNSYWHHQIMIYTFAFVSLICGLLSLYWIQKIWEATFSKYWSMIFVIASVILAGYGIFLGRIQRFNSWDLFTHPMALLKYVLHSFSNPTAILMTFEFSVFIGLAYCMLHSLIHLNDQ
ncbi:DUF1361 domain-containing protein [Arcicella sp. DC2W]|uniref:DUF1361 domain-containing protein n=1 Tax=Arcicella gelida TaxID=2984195 RepID=A0ABU5SBZ9_9BACT|nr:DUF1361 domain-containing protein [Arcicella sp. DC2W]MEA5405930.1 DUF1361 domain-containing protein [Arcicella sp. DC2W]